MAADSRMDEFLEPSIVDGYVVRRETKEVWAVNLELLEVFQRLCDRHGLRYFMGFGTLLGAFRHGGFVPWDDDVDLLMPRRDFERLKSFAGEVKDPYFLQYTGNDVGFWHRGMMKLRHSGTTCIERRHLYADFNQGIALEILPLDHVPDDAALQQKQSMRNSILQRLLWAKLYRTDYQLEDDHGKVRCSAGWKWRCYRLAAFFFPVKKLEQWLFTNWTRYDDIVTKYCAIFTNYGGKVAHFCVEDFSDVVWMDFEGLSLPAPRGYWRCLEKHYGKAFLDYLPLEQRKPHHPAYWDVHTSYQESYARLRDLLKNMEGKISDNLDALFCNLNEVGKDEPDSACAYEVGYVEGDFEVLDGTTVTALRRMKMQCDYLIVGVLIETLQDVELRERLAMLEALRYVDRALVVRSGDTDRIKARYHVGRVFGI